MTQHDRLLRELRTAALNVKVQANKYAALVRADCGDADECEASEEIAEAAGTLQGLSLAERLDV